MILQILCIVIIFSAVPSLQGRLHELSQINLNTQVKMCSSKNNILSE